MKCYVSTDVGTWTNWLTFELDPDNSPDYFLRCRMHCNVQNFITLGKIPHTGIERGFCRPPKQRRMVLRRRKTVVRGECAVLVCKVFQHTSEMLVHYVLCCCRRWYRQCVRQSGDRLCTKPVSEAAVVLLRHSGDLHCPKRWVFSVSWWPSSSYLHSSCFHATSVNQLYAYTNTL